MMHFVAFDVQISIPKKEFKKNLAGLQSLAFRRLAKTVRQLKRCLIVVDIQHC